MFDQDVLNIYVQNDVLTLKWLRTPHSSIVQTFPNKSRSSLPSLQLQDHCV